MPTETWSPAEALGTAQVDETFDPIEALGGLTIDTSQRFVAGMGAYPSQPAGPPAPRETPTNFLAGMGKPSRSAEAMGFEIPKEPIYGVSWDKMDPDQRRRFSVSVATDAALQLPEPLVETFNRRLPFASYIADPLYVGKVAEAQAKIDAWKPTTPDRVPDDVRAALDFVGQYNANIERESERQRRMGFGGKVWEAAKSMPRMVVELGTMLALAPASVPAFVATPAAFGAQAAMAGGGAREVATAAAMGAGFGAIGAPVRSLVSAFEKVVGESAFMAAFTKATGGDTDDALVNAMIPLGFAGAAGLRKTYAAMMKAAKTPEAKRTVAAEARQAAAEAAAKPGQPTRSDMPDEPRGTARKAKAKATSDAVQAELAKPAAAPAAQPAPAAPQVQPEQPAQNVSGPVDRASLKPGDAVRIVMSGGKQIKGTVAEPGPNGEFRVQTGMGVVSPSDARPILKETPNAERQPSAAQPDGPRVEPQVAPEAQGQEAPPPEGGPRLPEGGQGAEPRPVAREEARPEVQASVQPSVPPAPDVAAKAAKPSTEQLFSIAEKMDLTDEIERLTAAGFNEAGIRERLFPGARDDVARAEFEDIVRAVWSKRGIPPTGDKSAFRSWLANRSRTVRGSVEPPSRPPDVASKQPWEMTQAEFRKYPIPEPWADDVRMRDLNHMYSVSDALRAGKPVPPEVLADYPDLKPPAPSAVAPAEPPPEQPKTPLTDWLSRFDPMWIGRIKPTLTKQRMINGKADTQAQYIERSVAAGARTATAKNGRRILQFPDGRFMYESDLSKAALDYADYLAKQPPAPSAAAAAEPAQAPAATPGVRTPASEVPYAYAADKPSPERARAQMEAKGTAGRIARLRREFDEAYRTYDSVSEGLLERPESKKRIADAGKGYKGKGARDQAESARSMERAKILGEAAELEPLRAAYKKARAALEAVENEKYDAEQRANELSKQEEAAADEQYRAAMETYGTDELEALAKKLVTTDKASESRQYEIVTAITAQREQVAREKAQAEAVAASDAKAAADAAQQQQATEDIRRVIENTLGARQEVSPPAEAGPVPESVFLLSGGTEADAPIRGPRHVIPAGYFVDAQTGDVGVTGKPLYRTESGWGFEGKLETTWGKEVVTGAELGWIAKLSPQRWPSFERDADLRPLTIEQARRISEAVDAKRREKLVSIDTGIRGVEFWATPGQEEAVRALAENAKKSPSEAAAEPKAAKGGKPKEVQGPFKTLAQKIEGLYKAAAQEVSRYAINGVNVEGDKIVATDGRRLWILREPAGVPDGIYVLGENPKGALTTPDVSGSKFPDYESIVPKVKSDQPNAEFDPRDVFARAQQASRVAPDVVDIGSRGGKKTYRPILLVQNPDGTLGFAANNPEIGTAEINVQEGAKPVVAFNSQFFMDQLAWHARNGDKTVKLWWSETDSWSRPIVTEGSGGKTTGVLMPTSTQIELSGPYKLQPAEPQPDVQKPGMLPAAPEAERVQAEAAATPEIKPLASGFPIPLAAKEVRRVDWVPEAVKFPDEAVENRLQAAHGVPSKSIIRTLVNAVVKTAHVFTRSQENIPNAPKFAVANEFFRQLKNVTATTSDEANRRIGAILEPLGGPQQLATFERKLLAENMLYALANEQPRRFGIERVEQVQAYKNQIDAVVAQVPAVQRALENRRAVVAELVKTAQEYGLLPEKGLQDPDSYVHQQVLGQLQLARFAGGRKPRPIKRGFQKARVTGLEELGPEYDYNTSIIEADATWMTELMIEVAKKKLANDYLRRPYHEPMVAALKAEAAARGVEDWHDLLREYPDLRAWQPQPGNYFYRATTIPERLAEQLRQNEIQAANVTLDDVRQLLALGGKREELILPREVASELDKMQKPAGSHPLQQAVRSSLNAWKQYTLLRPTHALTYNLCNYVGDQIPVLAAGAESMTRVARDVPELLDYYRGGLAMSERLRLARDLGVMDASLTAQELPDVRSLEIFKRFDERGTNWAKLPADLVRSYYQTVSRYSRFREAMLRYSTFNYALDTLQSGKGLRHYGGTKPSVFRALLNTMGAEVAAAYWSRNLMGDYGNLTVAGTYIRNHVAPFWSWQEVNFGRTTRLAANQLRWAIDSALNRKRLTTQGREALPAVEGAELPKPPAEPTTSSLLTAPLYVASAALGLAGVSAAMWSWNNLVHPEWEEALSPAERASEHLVIGKNPDGSVKILRAAGIFNDLFEWFGGPKLIEEAPKLAEGQTTPGQVAGEMGRAVLTKAVGAVRPEIKTPVELLVGGSLYPDATRPRSLPPGEIVSNAVGQRDAYREIKGRWTGSGERSRPGFFQRMLGRSDPQMNALGEIHELRNDFMVSVGKPPPEVYGQSTTRVMRDAAVLGDAAAFRAARGVYLSNPNNGAERFLDSVRRIDPIDTRLNDADEQKFMNEFLTGAQRDKLKVARDYARKIQAAMVYQWEQAEKDDPRNTTLARLLYSASEPPPHKPKHYNNAEDQLAYAKSMREWQSRNEFAWNALGGLDLEPTRAAEILKADFKRRGKSVLLVNPQTHDKTEYGRRMDRLRAALQK